VKVTPKELEALDAGNFKVRIRVDWQYCRGGALFNVLLFGQFCHCDTGRLWVSPGSNSSRMIHRFSELTHDLSCRMNSENYVFLVLKTISKDNVQLIRLAKW